MYLGHLLFLGGLAFALGSPLAAALGAGQALTLVRHVRIDEQRLARQFGAEYADYRARVGRWFACFLTHPSASLTLNSLEFSRRPLLEVGRGGGI
jgi:protein-S-isoprenylcysteine O-methyltransferase Ste14